MVEHVKDPGSAKQKKPKRMLELQKLRRQDSNVRPPGYEPGELPTAPLRDVNFT